MHSTSTSRVKLPLQHTRGWPLLSPKVKYCWHTTELLRVLPYPGGSPPTAVIIVTSRHLAEEAAYGSTSKHFLSPEVKSSQLKPHTTFCLQKEQTQNVIIVTPVIIVTSRHLAEEAAYGSTSKHFLSLEVKSSRLKPPSSKGFSRGSTLRALHVTSHLRPLRVSATNGWSPCLDMVKTLTWQPQA